MKTHISSNGAKSVTVIVDVGQGTFISTGREKFPAKDSYWALANGMYTVERDVTRKLDLTKRGPPHTPAMLHVSHKSSTSHGDIYSYIILSGYKMSIQGF